MTRPACLLAVPAALAGALLINAAGGRGAAPGGTDAKLYAPLDDGRFRFVGSSTCASADCHRGDGPSGTERSEFSTWHQYDPHKKAYSVLFDDRSVRMAKLYRKSESAKAHTDALCLKCHAVAPEAGREGDNLLVNTTAPGLGLRDENQYRSAVADGVGCEGCHGPASGYLATHYQGFWRGLSRGQKYEQYGLYPTKDLAFRTRMCAACHVGQKDQEVNHDLIAAGHPRLAFEYTAYHHSLPRHWRERAYGPDFDTRAWAVGQVATLRAAVALLAARAEAACEKKAPWPELSEYNCYSCHHGLQDKSWRQARGYPGRKPGTTPWQSWYKDEVAALAKHGGDLRLTGGVGADVCGRLEKTMEATYPPPEQVLEQAKAALVKLDEWSAQLQQSADRDAVAGVTLPSDGVRKLLAGLGRAAVSDGRLALEDWDQAAQRALTLAALYQSLYTQEAAYRQPGYRDAVQGLLTPLKFRPVRRDPAAPPPLRRDYLLDSPASYNPNAEFVKALQGVTSLFGQ